MPFANYANFADCVRQNPQADDPNAYCGSIQARTENKLAKAVTAASHLNQAVRLALSAVVAKAHDPVKEEGDKKLKEADGAANEGAQDDQAFAVAFGPDNYDKLTKRIMVAPYREAYQAAGAIVKAIERKQVNMNFPGNLEDHLKKAHAAVHGREMWDERYSDICDLLKKARKLLHDIEREAEAADQEQQGQEVKQVVGKADPIDKAGPPAVGPGVTGPWQKESRVAPSGGGRPMPEPIAPHQETTAQRRSRWQARNKAARQHGKDIYGKRPGATGPGPAHVHPHKTGPTASRKSSYAYKAVRKAVAAAGR